MSHDVFLMLAWVIEKDVTWFVDSRERLACKQRILKRQTVNRPSNNGWIFVGDWHATNNRWHRPCLGLVLTSQTSVECCKHRAEIFWIESRLWCQYYIRCRLVNLSVGHQRIGPHWYTRHIGVMSNSDLSMKHDMSFVASRSCFRHIRRLREIRPRAGHDVAVGFVITSQLLQCRSVRTSSILQPAAAASQKRRCST